MTHPVAPTGTQIISIQPLEQPPSQPVDSPATQKKAVKPARGVYEHPPNSKIWWINYYVEGKRHREKIGNRQAAIDTYRKRKNDARVGIKLPDSIKAKKAVLFEDLAKDAMVYSAAHKRSHRGDLSNLNSLLPVFGKERADAITPQMISDYFATRTDLMPASLNRYRSTMSMIYAEGIRNGRVSVNPARLVRLRRENNARIRFLTIDEEEQIRAIIRKRSPKHEPDFTVAIETGMRLSEQHTLEWEDVHLERRQIQLIQTKNGSSRIVTLSRDAVAALKILQRRRTAGTNRVFLTRYGKPMQNPKAWFQLVMKDAIEQNRELANVTWHVLRHTAISRAVMGGNGLREVQDFAGHKSITMTARYAHLSPEHRLEAVDRMTAYKEMERKKAVAKKRRSKGKNKA